MFLYVTPFVVVWLALKRGPSDWCRHVTTKCIFKVRYGLPFRLDSFLRHCTDRAVLYKTRGGYVFIHHLLQEYFADRASQQS
jgi:hypothetical protein